MDPMIGLALLICVTLYCRILEKIGMGSRDSLTTALRHQISILDRSKECLVSSSILI